MYFFVKGKPKAQPRPKARRIGSFVRIYTPDTAKDWKDAIKFECYKIKENFDLSGAFICSLSFYFLRPKSHYKKSGGLVKGAKKLHIYKPDLDNLEKGVLDAITNSGQAWKDDSQIVELSSRKQWTDDPSEEGVWVTISQEI